jgi:polar amino acid transport system ATP-binding protein
MLEIQGLRKSYGKLWHLDGVDLTVDKGETVVIMGPSGCGKSTLIRCVNRLTEPDEGTILLDGKSVLEIGWSRTPGSQAQCGFCLSAVQPDQAA